LLQAEGSTAAKILAIRKKLAADTAALLAAGIEDQKKIDQAKFDLEVQIARKALDLLQTIGDGRYENERNQIQATIDALHTKTQADIDAVNATNVSAEAKAKAIADINGRAAIQEKQLSDQQKRLDIEKAQFDKEKAILDIVINTAVAVSKAFAQGPTGIATIPFITALGAIEIALVEAQPIPHYKHGAGLNGIPKHPGGEAEVGHGKSELAITPAGDLILTPSVPTRMYLPRDTTVLPDANAAIDALIYSSLTGLERHATPPPDSRILQATNQLIKENRRLQQIIANKKEAHFHGSWAGWEAGMRAGNRWIKWVDDKTNF